MEILRIGVSGYKNIVDTVIEFEGHSAVAVVSLNNYGKSNLLDAIYFGRRLLADETYPPELFRNSNALIPAFDIEDSNAYPIYSFWMEGVFEEVPFWYGLNYSWGGGFLIGEIFRMKLDSQKYTTLFEQMSPDDGRFKSHKAAKRFDKALSLQSFRPMLVSLSKQKDLDYGDCLRAILDAKVGVIRPFSPKSYRESSGNFPNNSILAQQLYEIRQQDGILYEQVVDAFENLFPELSLLSPQRISAEEQLAKENPEMASMLKEKQALYTLFVHDVRLGQVVRFESMSDGTIKVLRLLAHAANTIMRSTHLLCVEEIENAVHPKLFGDLIASLEQLAGGRCTFLFSSHSPYALEYLPVDAIYIGMPLGGDTGASFHRLSKSGQKKILRYANLVERSVGETIFELLSGDEEDLELLRGALAIPKKTIEIATQYVRTRKDPALQDPDEDVKLLELSE